MDRSLCRQKKRLLVRCVRAKGVRGKGAEKDQRACTAYLVEVHAAKKEDNEEQKSRCQDTLKLIAGAAVAHCSTHRCHSHLLNLSLITAVLIAPTTRSKERDTASACLSNLALVLVGLACLFNSALVLAWLAISQLPLLCANEGQKKRKVVQSTPRAGCKPWYSKN